MLFGVETPVGTLQPLGLLRHFLLDMPFGVETPVGTRPVSFISTIVRHAVRRGNARGHLLDVRHFHNALDMPFGVETPVDTLVLMYFLLQVGRALPRD
jgi:hypothetical protein